MTQRQTISGRRSCVLYAAILTALALIVAGIALVVVVRPELERRRQAETRLTEAERHYQAGVAFQTTGNLEKARSEYEQAIAIDANYKEVQTKYAEVQARLLETHYSDGTVYFEQGLWTEAIAAFDKVIAIDPSYRDAQAKRVEAIRRGSATPTAETTATRDTATPRSASTATDTAKPLDTATPISTPTLTAASNSCSFIQTTLVHKGIVLQRLDVPSGSGSIAGVQIRIDSPVQVPRGWIVQRGKGDEFGPVDLTVGEVASVWSPEHCRPLGPIDHGLDCTFFETLATKVEVLSRIGEMGAQVRIREPVSIPRGWIVQRGRGDEYGPTDLTTVGEVASIYAPEPCRPLSIP